MTDKPLRVLRIAAVSTQAQAEDDKYSIPSQIAEMDTLCAQWEADYPGLVIVDTIVIAGHSRKFRTLAELVDASLKRGVTEFQRFSHHLHDRTFDVLLVRDANRLARKASLLHQIVDILIEDCKARIYSYADGFGWVDRRNVDGWLMVKSYETEAQSRWIAQSMQHAKLSLLDKGLPHNVGLCWAYKRIRDNETGTVLKIVPDPAKLPIVEAAARTLVYGAKTLPDTIRRVRPAMPPPAWHPRPRLVMQSVSFHRIERVLWYKYRMGHSGKPFRRDFFYGLFWNPTLHGNKAMNHQSSIHPNGRKVAPWAFDPSFPLPPEVEIRYGVIEPALPPPLLRALQYELIRRYDAGTHYRTENTHRFTGLIVCARCGYNMVYHRHKGCERWICQSGSAKREGLTCPRKHGINERILRTWMTERILEAIAGQWDTLFQHEDDPAAANHVAALKGELARVQGEADRLVTQVRKAPPELVDTFTRQMQTVAAELRTLKAALAKAEREALVQDERAGQDALDEIKCLDSIQAFWQRDENSINRLLRQLMGRWRIAVTDGLIVGTRLAAS